MNSLRTADEHLGFWREHLGTGALFVYVIQAQPGTPIKVGVAKDPHARLKSLQIGNPADLRLLFVVPGDHALEAAFHRRLADSSVRGEWFAEPGINGFLEWMDEFATQGIVHFGLTGQLQSLPENNKSERIRRRGFGPYGMRNAKLGHRWRSSAERQSPITIRYLDPEPMMDVEQARKIREAFASAPSTSHFFPLPDKILN